MAPHKPKDLVTLTLLPNFGPIAFKKLLEQCGSVSAILERKKKEIESLGLSKQADREMAKAAKAGVRIVSFFDKEYSNLLKEIYDPPILLYVKGKLPKNDLPAVAVVGSRVPSLYGQKMSRKISRELAASGVVVVSGLAVGIDAAAHEGALEGGGLTVAVLGGGISRLYPPQNSKLAEAIAKKGAVISEYPMQMPPSPKYFPVRNRIISGLSRATLVVEAKRKSGALITASLALEQGRDVFAVPGNADSPRSDGTNDLIKQGARPVTGAADIFEELGLENSPVIAQAAGAILSKEENKIFSILNGEALHVDEIAARSEFSLNRVMALLLQLELKGKVKAMAGQHYVKN